MEALGGERRYSSYSFLTSALDGGEWSASRPGRAFTPGERTPGTHWRGGWVGPRAGLDTEARGKILCPRLESNPDRPVVQPVVRHYTDWANPAPTCHSGPLKSSKAVPLRHAGAKEETSIAPTHSWIRHYIWVSGQRHSPAALYPLGVDTLYPLNRELGGPQSWSGHRLEEKSFEHRSSSL
jgi:hypothetical protein